MENNLPVGSVVLLKGGTRGVVIIGYGAMEQGSKKNMGLFRLRLSNGCSKF